MSNNDQLDLIVANHKRDIRAARIRNLALIVFGLLWCLMMAAGAPIGMATGGAGFIALAIWVVVRGMVWVFIDPQ